MFGMLMCVQGTFFWDEGRGRGCAWGKGVNLRRCVQRKHGEANSVETREKLTTRHRLRGRSMHRARNLLESERDTFTWFIQRRPCWATCSCSFWSADEKGLVCGAVSPLNVRTTKGVLTWLRCIQTSWWQTQLTDHRRPTLPTFFSCFKPRV